VFQLIDQYLPEASPGWPAPKQIYCLDANTNGFMFERLSNNAVVDSFSIPFTSLVLAQCPAGASYEIDIA
jgi:hypothetical protein